VLPLSAGALDLLLWWRGQAWSLSDWASSFGLGAVTTMVVGMLLARRQTGIQEALADLELTEKVGALNFAVSGLRDTGTPGPARRSLYDCRAGLALLPLARRPMQDEYLRTVAGVLATLDTSLGSSLHSRARWTREDWSDLNRAVEGLRETALLHVPRSPVMADHWSREIDGRTAALLRVSSGAVTFEVFRRHFTQGRDRIRTALAWEPLARLADDGSGAVRVETLSIDVAAYDVSALAGYHAPWYGDGAGEVPYGHPDAAPIRHTELATGLAVLDPDRRSRVVALREQYAARVDGREIAVTLATYDLGGGRCLVLDGNHRLTALVQLIVQGCPVRVTDFRLTAPLDPALLPDLRHFTAS
jgi:hypothetical protein